MITKVQEQVIKKAKRIAEGGSINLHISESDQDNIISIIFEDGTDIWSIYIGPNGGLNSLFVYSVTPTDFPSKYVRNKKKAERFVRYGYNIIGEDSDRLLSFGPLVEAVSFADKARNFVIANGR